MSGADTPERARACTRDRGAISTACSGAQAERLVIMLPGQCERRCMDVRNETFKNERRKMPEKEWGEEENEARLVKRVENSRRKKSTVSTASERRKNWP